MERKNLLKGLMLPKDIEYNVEKEEGSNSEFARISAFPFERGFGTTIGNTLRRVLLSSIQGYAVSAVMFTAKTDGKVIQISNEFESIPGVKEDIAEIIANLKKLRIKVANESSESVQVVVSCKGPGVITGKDLEKNGVEIVNSDIVILTMDKGVDIDMEIQIDFGRGYIPSDQHSKYIEQHGVIAVDSLFSPVLRVSYSVEPARVGQRNDFDRLNLEITTNGTISAVDALGQAAFITQTFLSKFINFNKESVVNVNEFVEEENNKSSLLKSPIDVLELSTRSLNCLKRVNINFIYELVRKSEKELSVERNFGSKSLTEIKEKLTSMGLSLGMSDADANIANK